LHRGRPYHYDPATLTDESIDQASGNGTPAGDRRERLLRAAVRVFAERGYHRARVGDIAEEAGVAHGLLYHYFPSKEDVLRTIFRDSWSRLIAALHGIEAAGGPAPEQLRRVAAVLLRSWRDDPDLVRVLVREVARSPHLSEQVDEVREAFLVIERVIARGQAEGSFRPDLDARLASWIVYGSLEELLTGWVLGQLPEGDEEVARAERTVIDVVCGGLARNGAAASA
jgi:TetR/AcrR family transcriptional regulator, fatty acid metabolism regulator protein